MPGSERASGHHLALAEDAGGRRFERVLEQLPQAVVLFDRDLVIEYANPAARSLFGGAAGAGQPLPDPWPEFSLRTLAARLCGQGPPVAGTFLRTAERVFWIEGVPPSEKENAILVVEDVTDRERARQGEHEFLENAAHELRTPLAAIISVMDVLESGAKDVPEVRDRFLKHIRLHSERLSRLARSLLVLARVQSGVEQPHLAAVALRPLLAEVADHLEVSQGVDVHVRAEPDVGVLADPDLLHRVVANVAENAAKHTNAGEIVLEARKNGNATEIEVRDTGPGMSADQRERAFQRFYRSGDDGTDGFGLGLAIAREAVRVLSGTIELDSVPAAGTRIRIALPSAKILS